MEINWRHVAAAVVLAGALVVPAYAQSTSSMPASAGQSIQVTAKVVAIDYTSRVVTLQDSQGNTMQLTAGPEVKRLKDVKVGDTITFTYAEAVAMAIVKPGTAAPESQATPVVTRSTGSKPSGSMTQTQTAQVTIQAIDMQKPSVTVKTADGRVLSFAVEDKNNLTGLKVGDVVQITYKQALMVNVQ